MKIIPATANVPSALACLRVDRSRADAHGTAAKKSGVMHWIGISCEQASMLVQAGYAVAEMRRDGDRCKCAFDGQPRHILSAAGALWLPLACQLDVNAIAPHRSCVWSADIPFWNAAGRELLLNGAQSSSDLFCNSHSASTTSTTARAAAIAQLVGTDPGIRAIFDP